jgi:hypothetical protein
VENNNSGAAWDMSSLAGHEAARQAAAQIAAMTGVFHKRLCADGLTREEATELCHTFLTGYFDTVQARQAPQQP